MMFIEQNPLQYKFPTKYALKRSLDETIITTTTTATATATLEPLATLQNNNNNHKTEELSLANDSSGKSLTKKVVNCEKDKSVPKIEINGNSETSAQEKEASKSPTSSSLLPPSTSTTKICNFPKRPTLEIALKIENGDNADVKIEEAAEEEEEEKFELFDVVDAAEYDIPQDSGDIQKVPTIEKIDAAEPQKVKLFYEISERNKNKSPPVLAATKTKIRNINNFQPRRESTDDDDDDEEFVVQIVSKKKLCSASVEKRQFPFDASAFKQRKHSQNFDESFEFIKYKRPKLKLSPQASRNQHRSKPLVLNQFLCPNTSETALDRDYNPILFWEAEADVVSELESLQAPQMGFDFLQKLKSFLPKRGNTVENSNNNSNNNNTRKRSSSDCPVVDPLEHSFKYKRVNNYFPKYAQPDSEEGGLVADGIHSTPYPRASSGYKNQPLITRNSNNRFIPPLLRYNSRNNLGMKRQDAPPKPRKSIFTAPELTHRLVQNPSFADIEFSDSDDAAALIRTQPTSIISNGYETATAAHQSKVYNIPIRCTNEPASACGNIQRSDSILAQSLGTTAAATSIFTGHTRKLSYADVLRKEPFETGYILGSGRTGSTIPSSRMSTSTNTGKEYSGLGSIRGSSFLNATKSIRNQEKENESHSDYRKLLESLLPDTYGTQSKTMKLSQQKQQPLSISSGPQNRRSIHRQPVTLNKLNLHNGFGSKPLSLRNTYRPPSTINLDDDDENEDDDDEDVSMTGITYIREPRQKPIVAATVVIDDDDEISDCIDLSGDEPTINQINQSSKDAKKTEIKELPYVTPVNSLRDQLKSMPAVRESWLADFEAKSILRQEKDSRVLTEYTKIAEQLTAERLAAERDLNHRMKDFQIFDRDTIVIDDSESESEPKEKEIFELTAEQQNAVRAALCGPADEVLIFKFNTNIARRDILTLQGTNWLNDEVINFYMNLLIERGEKKQQAHGYPSVYAMNTFFVPRLLSSGHSGVKRWTRKVDIFSKDIIPVPVHVGGVHWCMAIIHLKQRSIKYYDSMGSPNPTVLAALEKYLQEESLDKLKRPFDTSNFLIESVKDVPRQQNGSDCGVFSCMFAEYVARNHEITFTQQHMEYFRQKMILEIIQGQLFT